MRESSFAVKMMANRFMALILLWNYEKGDYGEFLRYGIGGELQNRYVAFAANLYLPITDDKHTGSTVAFSQKGYDANLRINIPQLDFLKVRADYYHFDGKYGGENDNGFRYGLELQPINNLRIGAFYDDGGEKFGGDIAYIYNISADNCKSGNQLVLPPTCFRRLCGNIHNGCITATTGPQIRKFCGNTDFDDIYGIGNFRNNNYDNNDNAAFRRNCIQRAQMRESSFAVLMANRFMALILCRRYGL